jgi:hypothetical protein
LPQRRYLEALEGPARVPVDARLPKTGLDDYAVSLLKAMA